MPRYFSRDDTSRRSFLKGGLAVAAGALFGSIPSLLFSGEDSGMELGYLGMPGHDKEDFMPWISRSIAKFYKNHSNELKNRKYWCKDLADPVFWFIWLEENNPGPGCDSSGYCYIRVPRDYLESLPVKPRDEILDMGKYRKLPVKT